jgi:prepilin-type N-terminal cleavage/methylation domain-containing protein/prepilin-type processing-associated H-X9-DG protein
MMSEWQRASVLRSSAVQPEGGGGEDGFTLVELLVVVAIIGLLVSLLLPSVTGSMERARDIQCMANLHSVGYVFLQMLMEDGFKWETSVGHMKAADPTWPERWPIQLETGGYLESRNVLYCPKLHPRRDLYDPNYAGWMNEVGFALFTFDGTVGKREVFPGMVMKYVANYRRVRSPADFLLLADSCLYGATKSYYHVHFRSPRGYAGAHLRHRGGQAANALCFDGHVSPSDADRLHDLGLDAFYNLKGEVIQ